MAKIWITGIAGFLGSHLAEALQVAGHLVKGNDNMSGGNARNIPQGVGYTLVDCRNWKAMLNEFNKFEPEIVYHCAAMAHEGLSSFSPAFIFDNVAQASVTTFSAAIAAGCKRIVFLSSMARYGRGLYINDLSLEWEHKGPPFSEQYETSPVDPYGIAKVAAEQALQVLCQTHQVDYQIAVPHNIIGTRQCYTDPFRNVASIFLNRLKQGKPGYIYGDGTQKRCFSPVQDIVPCLVKLGLDADLPNGHAWNLGPDKAEITINDLYMLCRGIARSVEQPIYQDGRPNEVPEAFCTADKAREQLGYESLTPIEDCLIQMWQDIPEGGRSFRYDNRLLEIEDGAPAVWKERLM